MGHHTGGEGIRPIRRDARKAHGVDTIVKTPARGTPARAVVQWFRDAGCSNVQIEDKTELPHSFVHRWTARKDAHTQPGRGPKRLIDKSLGQELAETVRKKRFKSANKLRAKVINPKTQKMCAASTICRALDAQGLTAVKVLRCQKLGHLDTEKRLAWCEEMHNQPGWEKQWMFTDEKWFNVGGIQGHEIIWVDKDDKYPNERYVGKRLHPKKIHVWAGITVDGRTSLHIHGGNVNSSTYIKCVKEACIPALFDKEYVAWKRNQQYTFM
jgi:transposase